MLPDESINLTGKARLLIVRLGLMYANCTVRPNEFIDKFQQSVVQGCFPSSWKKAIVVPIHKGNGPKDIALLYKPISQCSTIGKTLERIVKNQLLTLVNEHSAMNCAKHGFTNNRSAITNLLITERYLVEAANSRESMDVISFDFSRAFDRVPHNIIVVFLVEL